jgi:pimeloyl-ACP methyl ester carboxylesterase
MKHNLIFIFILYCIFGGKANAQEPKEILRDWVAYSQGIDISKYEGREFRVSGMIRKDNPKDISKAALWARIDKKDKSNGFFHNDLYFKNSTTQWEYYEISDTVVKDSHYLYFGACCMNNGSYYFDNFKLEIKDDVKGWEVIPINNPGFENEAGTDEWRKSTSGKTKKNVKNFSVTYSKNNPFEGDFCLYIKGEGIIGSDEAHGNTLNVNGVKLYYETYGAGEPLLMIHGNGQSIGAFLQQYEEFSKHYKLILVDSRGRGQSTYQHGVELTYSLQALDMKLLLDSLKLDSVNIVGWSDGGIIGLMMAIKYPEKVKKLVAMGANINPQGLPDLEEMKETVKTFKDPLSIDLYNLMINYPKLEYDDLKVIKIPTLIMAGDHDLIANIHTVKMFEALPKGQLAILPNETHYLPEENPKLFNEIVLKFLNNPEN